MAADTASSLDRLRAQLDRESEPHPTAWKPEPGDELYGTFEGWTSGTTSRNETHPIALVRELEGERLAIWCFYAVLRDEMKKAEPKPGELIAIKRLPDRESKEGVKYRHYRVVMDRDQAEPFADFDPPVEEKRAPSGDWLFSDGRKL